MNGKAKRGFLVVAHGSRKDEANQQVFALVKRLRNYFQTDMFEPALMELASPSIEDGIKVLAEKGVEDMVVCPFFLFKGMHFTRDVPQIIQDAIDKLDKKMTYKMLEPLGLHPLIFDLTKDILYEEVVDQFKFNKVEPSKIEGKSMDIIENHIDNYEIEADQKPVVKRVIHTTGDFDFVKSMIFRNDAISQGLEAISAKKTIYTDVTMVQAGINKRFGHEVRCVLNEPAVTKRAQVDGSTRAAAGIKSLGHELDGNVVAIGNAPTALITLVEMVRDDGVKPALIVGIPVGFVNAKESKEYLSTLQEVPYITNRGHKGGSTVAAAIVNALIKIEFMDKQEQVVLDRVGL